MYIIAVVMRAAGRWHRRDNLLAKLYQQSSVLLYVGMMEIC